MLADNPPRATLNLDMQPVVPAEVPVLLRHHLALAARLYEVLPEDTANDAILRGMEEPGRQAAREFLISLSGYYNLEDDGD